MSSCRCQAPVTLGLVMFLCVGSVALAQVRSDPAAPSRSTRPSVAIRKLEGRGRSSLVLTPRYESSVSDEGRKLREWGRVRVEYASRPEWLDELTIRFFALVIVFSPSRIPSLPKHPQRES